MLLSKEIISTGIWFLYNKIIGKYNFIYRQNIVSFTNCIIAIMLLVHNKNWLCRYSMTGYYIIDLLNEKSIYSIFVWHHILTIYTLTYLTYNPNYEDNNINYQEISRYGALLAEISNIPIYINYYLYKEKSQQLKTFLWLQIIFSIVFRICGTWRMYYDCIEKKRILYILTLFQFVSILWLYKIYRQIKII